MASISERVGSRKQCEHCGKSLLLILGRHGDSEWAHIFKNDVDRCDRIRLKITPNVERKVVPPVNIVVHISKKTGYMKFTLVPGAPIGPGIYEGKITDVIWSE